MLKWTLLIIIVFLVGLYILREVTWPINPYPEQQANLDSIPKFSPLEVDFVHKYDAKKSLPFMGAAIFNLTGNDEQYLFVGGGFNQEDKLFKYSDHRFIDVSKEAGLQKPENDTTYGVVAVDANRDGLPDLFVARDSGVYFYENQNGKFSIKKLDIKMDPRYSPISIATADLQKKVRLISMSQLTSNLTMLKDNQFSIKKIMGPKAYCCKITVIIPLPILLIVPG